MIERAPECDLLHPIVHLVDHFFQLQRVVEIRHLTSPIFCTTRSESLHQRFLRERLQARDNNTLDALRQGQQVTFGEWADFFLANYSKPPIRAAKTHEGKRMRAEESAASVRTDEDDRDRCYANRDLSAPNGSKRASESGDGAVSLNSDS